MKLKIKIATALMVFIAVFSFTVSAHAILQAVSPTNNPINGFPLWYQDFNGLQLGLCTDPVNCIVTPPIIGNAFSQTIGFGAEMFYFVADSDRLTVGPQVAGGPTDLVRLRLALEGGFLSVPPAVATAGDPQAGTQITFARINLSRIRSGAGCSAVNLAPCTLQPGATYAVQHPYGSFTFTADAAGEAISSLGGQAFRTQDGGVAALDFVSVLATPTTKIGPFLRAVTPAPPAGFIGNALITQTVTGSPVGQNFVTITGPNIGGPGVNTVTTNLFNLGGQIFAQLAQPDKIGIFRNGLWALDLNNNKVWNTPLGGDAVASFGLATDKPVAGDFNGDGTAEIGVFRNGVWVIDNGNRVFEGPPTDRAFTFGLATDTPVVGDWTGTGTSKIGVFRNGIWFLDMNGNGIWEGPIIDKQCTFGLATDKPVVGDWTGTGTSKIGVFRTSGTAGLWVLDLNGNCVWDGPIIDQRCNFGLATDKPIAGDWANTGTTDVGVVRNGVWFLDSFHNCRWDGPGIDRQASFGAPTDTPMVGGW